MPHRSPKLDSRHAAGREGAVSYNLQESGYQESGYTIAMNRLHGFCVAAAGALLCLNGVAAMASDKISITISNNGTDDVFATVRDMNTTPSTKLLWRARISGFASIPIFVTTDASGKGHVAWSAYTADPAIHKCGRKDKRGLANFASVHVYAKSECPAP